MARLDPTQTPLVPKMVRLDSDEWTALEEIDGRPVAHHIRAAVHEYLARHREPVDQTEQ